MDIKKFNKMVRFQQVWDNVVAACGWTLAIESFLKFEKTKDFRLCIGMLAGQLMVWDALSNSGGVRLTSTIFNEAEKHGGSTVMGITNKRTKEKVLSYRVTKVK